MLCILHRVLFSGKLDKQISSRLFSLFYFYKKGETELLKTTMYSIYIVFTFIFYFFIRDELRGEKRLGETI